ncbi:hypothetical protein L7F22_053735 [Adiantum nelumboides]|nr:hypothetical protein [Adiantum nelumboides]
MNRKIRSLEKQNVESDPDDLDLESAPLLSPSRSSKGLDLVNGLVSTAILELGPTKVEVRVDGMTCAPCSTSVEKALLRLPGVTSASVALLQSKAIVEYDSAMIKVHVTYPIVNFLMSITFLKKFTRIPTAIVF